jgi:DNA-binding transcriptional MerR regulator
MTQGRLGPRDVARATGVSTDTLRHYERKGLLANVGRTSAGYREYSAATVDRVLLIQRALVVGFTLDDLVKVLATRDRGGVPCQSVRDLVAGRLRDLDRHIQELIALRSELRELLTDWTGRLAKTPAGERAHLLEMLGAREVIEGARQKRKGSAPPRVSDRAHHRARSETRGRAR